MLRTEAALPPSLACSSCSASPCLGRPPEAGAIIAGYGSLCKLAAVDRSVNHHGHIREPRDDNEFDPRPAHAAFVELMVDKIASGMHVHGGGRPVGSDRPPGAAVRQRRR